MPLARPSRKEIEDRIYARIINETPLTANKDSSIIGQIIKINAAEYDALWSALEDLERRSKPTTAIGGELDSWGNLLGVPRRVAKQAGTTGFSRAVRLSNNSGGSVVVPSGTRIFKESDPRIAFFTTEAVSVAGGGSTDVHVTAAEIGEIFNVSIGELNRHSMPDAALTVTNILPIQNGSFLESDGSYRDRIIQELRRRNVLNPETLVALLRSVPGVRDVFLLDLNRGDGTFDVVIVPYNETAASQVVSECQALITENAPVGINGQAISPRYRQLDIEVTLRFAPDVGDRRETIRESIRAQIAARIDNLPLEDGSGVGTFYTHHIRPIALGLDPTAVLDATVKLGLDGSPLLSEGEVVLSVGERLVLRSLSVS